MKVWKGFLCISNHYSMKLRLAKTVPVNGEPLSPKSLSRAINHIQERIGIPHWTAHDLRRSFCTQLGETLHIDPVVIEKCLGHKMTKIMATYNRNEMLVQCKEALDKWSNFLESLLHYNVVPLSKCS